MKILSAKQIRAADEYTISTEPISSIDLMERASKAFVEVYVPHYESNQAVAIFCGTGNNGGDGLAIARLLNDRGFAVQVWVLGKEGVGSPDFLANYDRLPVPVLHILSPNDFPTLEEDTVIIDGLFGSGLNRPLEGLAAHLVDHLNSTSAMIVSIDVASGLYIDHPVNGNASIIMPERTISFQLPKLAFVQPELARFVGDWQVVDIGLDAAFIADQPTHYHLTQPEEIGGLLPERGRYMHKGDAGRVAIWAGSPHKMGAALLAAQACLRAGAGLLWMQIPHEGLSSLNVSIPEAMVVSQEELLDGGFQEKLQVIGIGPGIGTGEASVNFLRQLLEKTDRPVVLDADAITMMAENPQLLDLVPPGSVLTPHPGEFQRLVGTWENDYEKLEKLQSYCREYGFSMVLKGAFSAVCDRQGNIFFNPTGNPGMATGGTGDVLFGIVCGLCAQGLEPLAALKAGVFLHGLAGDLAEKDLGPNSLLATDIIRYLPNSFRQF